MTMFIDKNDDKIIKFKISDVENNKVNSLF